MCIVGAMMSRKHYRQVAAIIRAETMDDAMERVTVKLADMFAADNHAFQRQRFYEACGSNIVVR